MDRIKNREWYNSLKKSKLTPPGYVFGIVWPILYVLLAVSFLLTIKSPKCIGFCSPLVFFTAQMALNFIWTTVFFRMKMIKTALLLIYAILGQKRTQEIYKFAIKQKMRFFSYGDACLIWNKNE